jgi:DNA mismatch repair ATPase MutS
LIQLLSIVETQKNDTLESCQTEIERLELWYSQQQPSEFIQQRFQSFRRELLQIQQQIQMRQQNAACQWLIELTQHQDRLRQMTEVAEKLNAANSLLVYLKQTRSSTIAFWMTSRRINFGASFSTAKQFASRRRK